MAEKLLTDTNNISEQIINVSLFLQFVFILFLSPVNRESPFRFSAVEDEVATESIKHQKHSNKLFAKTLKFFY